MGENGRYGHRLGGHKPILVEVPWFEIGKVKEKFKSEPILGEKERIKNSVQKLKIEKVI